VLLVSSSGQMWKGAVGRVTGGAALPNGDRLVFGGAALPGTLLVLGTRHGNIKRVKVEDALSRPDNTWAPIIGLEDGDEVLFAGLASDEAHVFFATGGRDGVDARVLRFEARAVNPQATPSARGVAGIKLSDDTLVAGGVMAGEAGALVMLSANGFLKRVPLDEFPVQGRGGQGVVGLRVTAATGPMVGAAYAAAGSVVDVFSAKGKRLRLALAEVAEARRPAAGASLHRQYGDGQLFGGDALARVVALPPG
jgi:DNA gyrase subunit A